ncbi:MAG: S8 family serine peptidase [Deltaproteobacteria bacterium]|nr:S8 family serine peptidase [Deltaproteobacteria bacterium]
MTKKFGPAVLVAVAVMVFMAAPAWAYKDSFNVMIDGAEASGTTAIVSFRKAMSLADAESAVARGGARVRSFHTFQGTSHAAVELKKAGGFDTGDLTYTLVEFTGDVKTVVEKLRAMPEVEDANPNWVLYPSFTPNDPYYSQYQSNFPQIYVDKAWDLAKGTGTVVAVLDTGYLMSIDDRAQFILAGYDFNNNDTDATDSQGHGTHVSNTIAEATNNGLGAAGIAYDAAIMPLKVFPDNFGGAYEGDIIDAIYYAVANGADIISMSLGGPQYVSQSANAMTYAWTNDVTVFAASGNDGDSPVDYPAAYNNVIAVGSSRPHTPGTAASRSGFANFGTALDVLAPGEEIVQQTTSWWSGVGYYAFSGTSMSCPHAAAVAALMISAAGPDPDLVAEVMFETASNNGTWNQDTGWGEINAYEAVKRYKEVAGFGDDDDDDDGDDDADDDGVDGDIDCTDLLTLIYTECDLALFDNGEPMSGAKAHNLCQDATGPWDCVQDCADHEDVDNCGDFAGCIEELCSVQAEFTSSGDDDDDDDDASCGCGA